ncbi:hypothetical protein [Streptomyces sp.]|uniref:hypothetical protein n=1 Tax=Streptomyces sp. TaxID=1931 RepID=UPI002D37B45E|nr:hypothetical protein [Streptomyces sp.]HZF87838.1 hypothetical protein [Streptomyces sp.]
MKITLGNAGMLCRRSDHRDEPPEAVSGRAFADQGAFRLRLPASATPLADLPAPIEGTAGAAVAVAASSGATRGNTTRADPRQGPATPTGRIPDHVGAFSPSGPSWSSRPACATRTGRGVVEGDCEIAALVQRPAHPASDRHRSAFEPLALICGPLRGIPFWWSLIDMSFGVFGVIPLHVVRRDIKRLAALSPTPWTAPAT